MGIVTDCGGDPTNYTSLLNLIDENFILCAGAAMLHKQMESIITSK